MKPILPRQFSPHTCYITLAQCPLSRWFPQMLCCSEDGEFHIQGVYVLRRKAGRRGVQEGDVKPRGDHQSEYALIG